MSLEFEPYIREVFESVYREPHESKDDWNYKYAYLLNNMAINLVSIHQLFYIQFQQGYTLKDCLKELKETIQHTVYVDSIISKLNESN